MHTELIGREKLHEIIQSLIAIIVGLYALTDYIEDVENYTRTCDNCTESVIFLKEYGITVTSEMGRYVWASRQAHSVFMVIAVIFTYPVSRFVARFYNETYMDRRVGANLQVWYSVRSTLKTNINGSS